MLYCGIKFTHDGAVALIDDHKLVFCVEMEKLNNNPRFTSIEDTADVSGMLAEYGYKPEDIDVFAVDGWGGTDQDALALQPRLEIGDDRNRLAVKDNGRAFKLDVAAYRENSLADDVLAEQQFTGLLMGGRSFEYSSFLHATGHIMGAYCSSPFARKREDAYVLVWDGGMYPRLYYINPAGPTIENLGPIFLLIGNIYTIFSQHFGPFKVQGSFAKDNLSVAGKVMAYIALGQPRKDLLPHFEEIYRTKYDAPMGFANVLANEFKRRVAGNGYSDEDILASFHVYLENMLLEKLAKKIKRSGARSANLCISGGCGLNIKWNSAIRNSGMFKQVYVPPFPNDSGSALGMACAAMAVKSGDSGLDWSVYSGPVHKDIAPSAGWRKKDCSIQELAALLHNGGEPVVVVNGCAELGPRALGNRSILAPAVSATMKDLLNVAKQREDYRPVSPICLEHRAEEIFDPGTPDPFMLFDHQVRPNWLEKISAVVHLDGTARLQTVNASENPTIAELLTEYEALSGIPLLCNTSANYKGSGFFPDTRSAAEWDKLNYIWCSGVLYERETKLDLTTA